jgi:hypothetical protein
MYSKAPLATGAAVAPAALAYTGMSIIWILLAVFALFAAGAGLLRIIPRRER